MISNAVVDLLGLLAYSELSSFEQMSADAQTAPNLNDKAQMSKFASHEYENYEKICKKLKSLGVNPIDAMQPFTAPLDGYHKQLIPSSWNESLVKSYIGEGIAADFYREVSKYLDQETANLVDAVIADDGLTDFAVSNIRLACENDSVTAGRLALWGRRMMGEMIAQAANVAKQRNSFADLLLANESNESIPAALDSLLNRLTVGHARRMDVLGFAS